MAVCQRLQCPQIPGVPIVAVGSDPVVYTVQMQAIVGKLLNKLSNPAANAAMHSFLRSPPGKTLSKGGDLVSAYRTGSMDAKIYTHPLSGSKPSYFLTMEGVKDVAELLPNQDDSAKTQLITLLNDHLLDQSKAKACLQPIADEYHLVNQDEDIPDEMPVDEDGMLLITPSKWLQSHAVSIRCDAHNHVLVAKLATANAEKDAAVLKKELEKQLEHKEDLQRAAAKEKQDAAEIAAKDIALVKANAEKEALQKEIQHMRDC